jgi:Tol biopolymer transport system component
MHKTSIAAVAIAVPLLLLVTACDEVPPPVAPTKAAFDVTGAVASLERVTTEPLHELRPAISPDGRVLLFNVVINEGGVMKKTLVGVDPNTRGQRTLYTSDKSQSTDPAWLPDQSSYVYASDSPGSWSIIKALTSSPNAAVNVIAGGDVAQAPAWPTLSPDGKRMAFSTLARGGRQIAIIGTDGARLTLLGEGDSPAWSPDGKRLAFCRTVNGHHHLFLLDPETGTNLVQLTSGEFEQNDPAWSPDGQYLIFSTNRASVQENRQSQGRGLNLFIIGRDGTGLTQVTAGDGQAVEPNWGNDGWIYFASNQTGDFDIWRLLPAGKYGSLVPVAASAALVAPPPAPATGHAPGHAPAAPPSASTSGSGCMKDTDCKGDRVCERGSCVSPAKQAGPSTKSR